MGSSHLRGSATGKWVLVKYFANDLIADTDFERLDQYPITNNKDFDSARRKLPRRGRTSSEGRALPPVTSEKLLDPRIFDIPCKQFILTNISYYNTIISISFRSAIPVSKISHIPLYPGDISEICHNMPKFVLITDPRQGLVQVCFPLNRRKSLPQALGADQPAALGFSGDSGIEFALIPIIFHDSFGSTERPWLVSTR